VAVVLKMMSRSLKKNEIVLGNDKKDPETEKRQHGKKSCQPQKSEEKTSGENV
jgi:hypothetical protein